MSAWFTFEKCFKAQDFRWRMRHPLPVGVLQPVNLHFAATKLLLVSAWCLQLPLSLSILTLLPRDVQLILPISLRRFLENRHPYSTKRTSDTSDTRSLLKSLSSTNIPSIAKFRWVRAVESTAPGLKCQIGQIWSKNNLAILGDQATCRLILRSLPTHDEIVWIYLWVIAVDLYVYCGFLWHLNALGVLEQWQEAAKGSRFIDVYRIMPTTMRPWRTPSVKYVKCSNISNTFQPLDAVHADSRIDETWLLYWPNKKSDMAWQFPKNRDMRNLRKLLMTTNAI